MTYQFPADIQHRIQAQLATCQFANEDKVLREAISTLERELSLKRIQVMVKEADKDIAAGKIGPFDAAATHAALDRLLAENTQ